MTMFIQWFGKTSREIGFFFHSLFIVCASLVDTFVQCHALCICQMNMELNIHIQYSIPELWKKVRCKRHASQSLRFVFFFRMRAPLQLRGQNFAKMRCFCSMLVYVCFNYVFCMLYGSMGIVCCINFHTSCRTKSSFFFWRAICSRVIWIYVARRMRARSMHLLQKCPTPL